MKPQRTFTAIFTALLCILATACQKTPVNGHLDGQWRMTAMTQEGQPAQTPSPAVYWEINLHVIQFVDGNELTGSANMAYDSDAATLAIDMPQYLWDAWKHNLYRCGLRRNPSLWQVKTLTRSRLVLADGNLTLEFEKF